MSPSDERAGITGSREVDGLEALTIANADGTLEASWVPEAGMVCCSLLHRGEEVLGQRYGLRAYVEDRLTMGIPLLYPWANRLSADRFELGGETVDLRDAPRLKRDADGLPIHGLLTAAPGWDLLAHAPAGEGARIEARLDTSSDPDLLHAFPFPHLVTIEALIEPRRLTVTTTVTGTGPLPVPIAYGFHPYLRLPGVAREDCEVELPVSEQLELDERGLPTGRRLAADAADGPLGDRTFDDLFVAPAGARPFALSGGGRRIELAMDPGYPYAQIYAPAGEELIAFEPMTAPTDALVSGGVATVAPGSERSATFSITVT
jgi:aldose 1-epimerase